MFFYASIYAFTRLQQMHATHRVSTTEPKHLHGQRDKQVPSRWHKEASPFCWGPKETCKEGRSRLHDCSWRSIISTCFAKAPTQCTTFLSYKTHKCGTKWGHIVLVQILCAPSGRIWMDFTWWRKLGERNRQWEHVGLYNIHATNHHCCWKTTTTSWHFGRWFSNLHTPSNLKGTYTIVDNNSINDVHHSRQR